MAKVLSVKELQKKIALAEAAKASAALKAHEAAEKEKQEMVDRLTRPSGLSDDTGDREGLDHHQPRGRERAHLGAGVPLSPYHLHRQRPGDQPGRGGMGADADRHSQGDL